MRAAGNCACASDKNGRRFFAADFRDTWKTSMIHDTCVSHKLHRETWKYEYLLSWNRWLAWLEICCQPSNGSYHPPAAFIQIPRLRFSPGLDYSLLIGRGTCRTFSPGQLFTETPDRGMDIGESNRIEEKCRWKPFPNPNERNWEKFNG